MPSVPQLAESVIQTIEENEEAVWAWMSERHYAAPRRQPVEQAGDHLRVMVKQRFSLDALATACAGFHIYSGKQGQEPTYSVLQLCWMLLLKYLCGWSYAKTAEEVRSNSLARWFCGFRLKKATPCDVTLFRFETWVKTHEPYAFFGATLQQIDEDFPEERTAVQIGDTFAMYSVARPQSRTEMLRDGCLRMLSYLEQIAPPVYTSVMAQLDPEALFGKEDDLPEAWLEKEMRCALEESTAVAAKICRQLVEREISKLTFAHETARECASIECEALQRWIKRVDKILDDEFTFETNQDEVVVKAKLRKKPKKSAYRIGSTIDPDATYRYHNDQHDLAHSRAVS